MENKTKLFAFPPTSKPEDLELSEVFTPKSMREKMGKSENYKLFLTIPISDDQNITELISNNPGAQLMAYEEQKMVTINIKIAKQINGLKEFSVEVPENMTIEELNKYLWTQHKEIDGIMFKFMSKRVIKIDEKVTALNGKAIISQDKSTKKTKEEHPSQPSEEHTAQNTEEPKKVQEEEVSNISVTFKVSDDSKEVTKELSKSQKVSEVIDTFKGDFDDINTSAPYKLIENGVILSKDSTIGSVSNGRSSITIVFAPVEEVELTFKVQKDKKLFPIKISIDKDAKLSDAEPLIKEKEPSFEGHTFEYIYKMRKADPSTSISSIDSTKTIMVKLKKSENRKQLFRYNGSDFTLEFSPTTNWGTIKANVMAAKSIPDDSLVTFTYNGSELDDSEIVAGSKVPMDEAVIVRAQRLSFDEPQTSMPPSNDSQSMPVPHSDSGANDIPHNEIVDDLVSFGYERSVVEYFLDVLDGDGQKAYQLLEMRSGIIQNPDCIPSLMKNLNQSDPLSVLKFFHIDPSTIDLSQLGINHNQQDHSQSNEIQFSISKDLRGIIDSLDHSQVQSVKKIAATMGQTNLDEALQLYIACDKNEATALSCIN